MDAYTWLIVASVAMNLFGVAGYFWFRHESSMLDRRFGADGRDSAR